MRNAKGITSEEEGTAPDGKSNLQERMKSSRNELIMIFQLAVILEGASRIILNSVVCCNSTPFSSTEDYWNAAVNVYSCCSTSLSAFAVICILDFGHSNRKLSSCKGDPGLPRGFHKGLPVGSDSEHFLATYATPLFAYPTPKTIRAISRKADFWNAILCRAASVNCLRCTLLPMKGPS
ncbi:uncharacterized protein [Bos indicus]